MCRITNKPEKLAGLLAKLRETTMAKAAPKEVRRLDVENVKFILDALYESGIHWEDTVNLCKVPGEEVTIGYWLSEDVTSLKAALNAACKLLDHDPKKAVSNFHDALMLTVEIEDYRYELHFVDDEQFELAQLDKDVQFEGIATDEHNDDWLENEDLPVVEVKQVRQALKKSGIGMATVATRDNEYQIEFAGTKKQYEAALDAMADQFKMPSVPNPEDGYVRCYQHLDGVYGFIYKTGKGSKMIDIALEDPEAEEPETEAEATLPVVTLNELRNKLKKDGIVIPQKPTERGGNEYLVSFSGVRKDFAAALDGLVDSLELEPVEEPEDGYIREFNHGDGGYSFTFQGTKGKPPVIKLYVLSLPEPEVDEDAQEPEVDEEPVVLPSRRNRQEAESEPVSTKHRPEAKPDTHREVATVVTNKVALTDNADFEAVDARTLKLIKTLMLQQTEIIFDALIAAAK